MPVAWPQDDPLSWGTVGLGAFTLPGLARVQVKKGNEVEVKKPKGKAGATTTVQGPNPAAIEITTEFLRKEQLDAWWPIAEGLAPAKGSGEPVDIRHPKTAGYKINAVTVQDINDGYNDKGDIYTVKITCVEFRPAPKAKKATKTADKLEPRNNSLSSGNTGRYIAVEKPSRDSRNTGPTPNDGKPKASK